MKKKEENSEAPRSIYAAAALLAARTARDCPSGSAPWGASGGKDSGAHLLAQLPSLHDFHFFQSVAVARKWLGEAMPGL